MKNYREEKNYLFNRNNDYRLATNLLII